ncbi:enterochelin esterase [Pectobacterium araliae]|uniref:Enterochelin esterase n=1 Tax=Pectobacterium araliae TaxID=3073862 RepID=A0AAN0KBU8_9GAMM|nr:enterochelin esterase [Pectobacterium sp. MAFF 302110]
MPVMQCPNFIAELLSSSEVGTVCWWKRLAAVGTPVVAPSTTPQQVEMAFFWRDPHGDEQHSPIKQVYVDINGVTNHHSEAPQSLQRLSGTDVWFWSVVIPATWRGGYSLIPITHEQLPPEFQGDEEQRSQQQCQWWCSLFACAISDPLNPYQPLITCVGGDHSVAHMPNAPEQSAWCAWDEGKGERERLPCMTLFHWRSERLGNERRVWLYTNGERVQPGSRPLVIVLDGQRWVDELPLPMALEVETAQGNLPTAVWLFIDAIDGNYRAQELPCNADFWLALQQELLPLAASLATFSDDPDRTLIVGQSYGGLSALYAGLHWPQRFGRVLTQSGSFWWPNFQLMTRFDEREVLEPGWLVQEVQQQGPAAKPLVIFQEAGDREADICFVNQQMNQALMAAGHQVFFRIYSGGHDALCWRGGLIDGLRWLLADLADNSASTDNITISTDNKITGDSDESGTTKSV